MKRAGILYMVATGLVLGASGLISSCAQGNYGQQRPDYDQRPYDPNYGQYDQGYNQGYNQPGKPDFYGQLSPYGQWVNTPEYGRVWIPRVDPDFQPYASNGHWVWTEYGNTWVSDYTWGWAPFHYGRWFRDPYRGWAWVPGYDWGPAWVSWRSGGGYYGWAPLGPGININVNLTIPASYWVFVPDMYINSRYFYNYRVPRPQVVNIYQNTTIINNVYRVNNRVYGYGPRREDIERATRRPVPVYRVENTGRPGRDQVRGDAVGIYRPEGGRTTGPLDANRAGRGSSRVYNEPYDNRSDNPRSGDYSRGRGNAGTYGTPNSGTNGDNPRTAPAESPYPSAGGYGSSRGSRGRGSYEGQSQPGQSQPQQTAPQPSQQQAPREWGGRQQGGSYSQPQRDNNPDPGGRANSDNRSTEPQGGGYRSGRGSSRGPQQP